MTRLLLIPIFAMTAGCASGSPQVILKDHTFKVEIADDDRTRALGLMFRESLPDDHGMLFIFPREMPLSFWMKNTRIPLDIIYFDSELEMVSVVENAPPCRTPSCPSYPARGLAKYVLELNAGKAAELGLSRGDRLVLDLD